MAGDEENHERYRPGHLSSTEKKIGCLMYLLPFVTMGVAGAIDADREVMFWAMVIGLAPMTLFFAGFLFVAISAILEEIGWVWLIVGLVVLFLIGSQFRRDCSDVIDGGRYGEVSICVP